MPTEAAMNPGCLMPLVALALSACAAGGLQAGDPAGPAPRGAWAVVAIDGQAIDRSDGVTMQIGAGRIAGHGGCNDYAGTLQLTDTAFRAPHPGVTMMACPGRPGAIERRFLAALLAADAWRIDGAGALVLMAAGAEVLRAVPD